MSPLLKFPCTTCGASIGEHCHTASGVTATDSHAARYLAERDFYAAPCGIDGHDHARTYCPAPIPV